MRISLRAVSWVALLLTLCMAACQGKQKARKQATSARPAVEAQLRWQEVDTQGGLPIQLTGSDGQGLQLVSVRAQVIAQAPLAFTELHLRFRNPEPRVREGRFEITLPETAAISRFAMKIGDTYQEGEVVERRAAQQAYEDFLHRRQDPALLEQDAGNHFRARVFPIPAHGDKELILSYSEELGDPKVPYRLHLAGLPAMENLAVRVLGEGGELRIEKENFAPSGDLVLTGGHGAQANVALRAGELFMARVTPDLNPAPVAIKGLTVLLDTSASMALGYRARVERLTQLIDALQSSAGGDFPLEVVAFDQAAVSLYQGNAAGLRGRGEAALAGRSPLGASNLQDALQTLAKGQIQPRLLIVTDAVITAGSEQDAQLTQALKALGARGLQRADVLLVGGIHDRAVAQRLTNVLEERGLVMDEQRDDESLQFALTHRPSKDMSLSVNGASWWWPRTAAGMLPGESLLVVASLKPDAKEPTVHINKFAQERSAVLEVNEPLLRRAWARAKIRDLEEHLALIDPSAISQRASTTAEITALSTRYRVLSSRTALLVLETEDDYRRFNITRTALSDILVVGERGLEVLSGKQRGMVVADKAESKGKIAADDVMEGASRGAPRGGEEARREAPTARATDESDLMGARAAAPGAPAADVLAPPAAPAPPPADRDVRAARPTAERMAEPAPEEPIARERAADRAEALGADGFAGLNAGPLAASGGGGYSLRALGRGQVGNLGSASAERAITGRVRFTELEPPQPRGAFESSLVSAELRKRLRTFQICYEQGLRVDPQLQGAVDISFTINSGGIVPASYIRRDGTNDRRLAQCMSDVLKRLRFKPSPSENVLFSYRFELSPNTIADDARRAQVAARPYVDPLEAARQREWQERPKPNLSASLEGRLLNVLSAVEGHDAKGALFEAWRWRAEDPSSVLALIGLGAALTESGDLNEAARAYGSIVDLFPSRADMRRMAGHYLERLQQSGAMALAVDTYGRAREQRPDHPNSHRLYAWALVKQGDYQQALNVLHQGYSRSYPPGRFQGVERILRDDARIIATAYRAAHPDQTKTIDEMLSQLGVQPDATPSLRFVMSWETDANDVDFHIYDGKHGHAYFSRPNLPSGGELFADVRNGYGPECFRIDHPKAYPYELSAHYYARGPMGYGMGKVQIMNHDGKGHLRFDERPFVVMKDRAFVHMGVINRG